MNFTKYYSVHDMLNIQTFQIVIQYFLSTCKNIIKNHFGPLTTYLFVVPFKLIIIKEYTNNEM
jgi:hypothetical protein